MLGQTLDDAAGEAFDKGARLLGLGYPGGPEVDRLAREGDAERLRLPALAPRRRRSTSASRASRPRCSTRCATWATAPRRRRADLAASYQRAIVAALTARLAQAMGREKVPRVALGGGVAANSELREAAAELCAGLGVGLHVPPPELCTDNAAMIAAAARFTAPLAYPDYLASTPPRGS